MLLLFLSLHRLVAVGCVSLLPICFEMGTSSVEASPFIAVIPVLCKVLELVILYVLPSLVAICAVYAEFCSGNFRGFWEGVPRAVIAFRTQLLGKIEWCSSNSSSPDQNWMRILKLRPRRRRNRPHPLGEGD